MRGVHYFLVALGIAGANAAAIGSSKEKVCVPKSSSKPSSVRPSPSAPPCVNSPTDRQCWGIYDINTDYNNVVPDTGNTAEVISPSFFLAYPVSTGSLWKM
jgi:hypothetical protein